MRSLLQNMDLRNIMDNILAKANDGSEFICPPSEDGGISDAGISINWNAELAHSILDGGYSNRNAALAHSNKINNQIISIEMGFNPSNNKSITNRL